MRGRIGTVEIDGQRGRYLRSNTNVFLADWGYTVLRPILIEETAELVARFFVYETGSRNPRVMTAQEYGEFRDTLALAATGQDPLGEGVEHVVGLMEGAADDGAAAGAVEQGDLELPIMDLLAGGGEVGAAAAGTVGLGHGVPPGENAASVAEPPADGNAVERRQRDILALVGQAEAAMVGVSARPGSSVPWVYFSVPPAMVAERAGKLAEAGAVVELQDGVLYVESAP